MVSLARSAARFAPLLALALSAISATACATDDAVEDPEDLTVTDADTSADTEFDQETSDSKADGALGYQAVARLVVNAGIACVGDRVAVAVAVAKAESGFRPGISNTAGNAHGVDRGLWQINSYWHPEVSRACAFSASCNARAAANISNHGRSWSQWWTYKNGKHLPFMGAARAAAHAVCGG